MRSSKRILCLILAVWLLLALSGCSIQFDDGFGNAETQKVENPLGFSLTLPADWQATEVEADDDYTQYAFENAAANVTLLVMAEAGGMEYLSLPEVGGMMTDELLATVYTSGQPEKATTQKNSYYRLIRGTTANSGELVSVLYLFDPFPAVRYHLLFSATSEGYEKEASVIDAICKSLTVTEDAETVYQWIQDKRNAEEDALLKENQTEENGEPMPLEIDGNSK